MRRWLLILVGISALGCKDHPASPPPAQGSAAQTAPIAPKPTPALPQTGSATPENGHDRAWAAATEKAIEAVAPDLTNVTCRTIDCEATLTAANEDDLVARAEKLQTEDSLKQLGEARGVVLSAPTKDASGKVSMTIRVLFDQ